MTPDKKKRPKTGGRKAGTPNKTNSDLRAKIEASRRGVSLPETLVQWAEELYGDGLIKEGADTLDKAARYLYPTLKSIEIDAKVEQMMPEPIEPGAAP